MNSCLRTKPMPKKTSTQKKRRPSRVQADLRAMGQQIAEIERELADAKREFQGKTPSKEYLAWREERRAVLSRLKEEQQKFQARRDQQRPPQLAVIAPPPPPQQSSDNGLSEGLLRRTYDYLKDVADVLAPESDDEDGFDLFEAIEEYLGIAV